MQKAPSRNIKHFARLLKPHGWTWSRGKRHVLFTGPEGQRVILACTCGDHRGLLNARAEFRRQGAPI